MSYTAVCGLPLFTRPKVLVEAIHLRPIHPVPWTADPGG